MQSLNWYNSLNFPPLTPPAWIFPPVWTFLYLTMLAALILFGFKTSSKDKSWGYAIFFSQLGLNLCWSPVFFYIKNPIVALVIIIILDILVFLNIIAFFKISKPAGWILLPYMIWILYATYLNLGIVLLNSF